MDSCELAAQVEKKSSEKLEIEENCSVLTLFMAYSVLVSRGKAINYNYQVFLILFRGNGLCAPSFVLSIESDLGSTKNCSFFPTANQISSIWFYDAFQFFSAYLGMCMDEYNFST